MLSSILVSLSFLSRNQRLKYFSLVAFRSLASLLDLVGIALIGLLAGLAASDLSQNNPITFGGFTLPRLSGQTLFLLVLVVLGVFLLKSLLSITLNKITTVFLARVESQKATEIAGHIFSGDLSRLSRFDRGQIVWATMGSPQFAFSQLLSNFATVITEGVLLLLIVAAFFFIDPVASLFVLFYFALIIVIIQLVVGRALRQVGIDVSEGNIECVEVLNDTANAFREIVVFNKRSFFLDLFTASRSRTAQSAGAQIFLTGMPRYIVETALILGVVIFVGFQFLSGQLASGFVTIGVFLTGGVRIMGSLLPLQNAISGVKIQVEQAKLAQQILAEHPASDGVHQTNAKEDPPARQSANSAPAALSVEISDVTFQYPGASRAAISNVSLSIKAGQHVALIGPSGAGKTTLVDLILGLVQPTVGSISVGNPGIPPTDLIEKGLVSYVPQQPGIVSGSLAANVALGVPAEDIDVEKVWRCLESAFLTDYVTELPEGIYSSVGSQANALSGGQVQRLGLARALYTDPKIIVLDEATSALDASSEAFISESISRLGTDVTVIVIAHRLSTVQFADKVFVLQDGEVVASGKFADLRRTVPMVAEYVKLMSFEAAEEE